MSAIAKKIHISLVCWSSVIPPKFRPTTHTFRHMSGWGNARSPQGHNSGYEKREPSTFAKFNDDKDRDFDEDWIERKQRACDFHNPAVLDVASRIKKKRMRPAYGHSSYLTQMGLPISSIDATSTSFNTHLTYMTKNKNAQPITCCSWSPGGRRCLTGNADGQMQVSERSYNRR